MHFYAKKCFENDTRVNNTLFAKCLITEVKKLEPYFYLIQIFKSEWVYSIIRTNLSIDDEFLLAILDVFETSKYRIINDTYNASFDSIMSALDILNSFNTRKVAILGDILELGDYSESIHRKIGKNIKCDLLITIGNHSKYINEETSIENYHFPTKEDFYEKANSLLKENDTILVKASHGIELDKVVEFLKDE